MVLTNEYYDNSEYIRDFDDYVKLCRTIGNLRIEREIIIMDVLYSVLKRTYDLHKEEYEAAALRALNSGWYILGKEMENLNNSLPDIWG